MNDINKTAAPAKTEQHIRISALPGLIKKIFFLCLAAVCAVLPGLFLGPAGTAPEVVLHFRLPRILSACIAGAALGLSGAIFQGVLKNPLADPYLLGTSAGASAAAAVCFLLGLDRGSPVFFFSVFAGAFSGTFLSYSLAMLSGKLSDSSLVLSGVAVSAFLTALIMLLANAGGEKTLQLFSFIMGGFSAASVKELSISGLILAAALVLSIAKARQLDAFSLGEEKAYHLGADPEKGRLVFFLLASAASAAAVALGGTIGFVGLMTPHIMRMLFSPLSGILLPAAAAGGAILLCAADTAGRTIFVPREVPAGILMALCGTPFFLWLLFRSSNPGKIQAFSKNKEEKISCGAISKKENRSIKIGQPTVQKYSAPDRNLTGQQEEKITKIFEGAARRQPMKALPAAFSQQKTAAAYGCPADTPLLKVSGLSVRFASRILFSGLDITLNSGEFLGILGPNGAGKSTLLKIISGFIKNDAEIFVSGQRRSSLSQRELAGKLAWLPGELETPYDFTVLDFVKMGCYAVLSNTGNPEKQQKENSVGSEIHRLPLSDNEKALNALAAAGAANLAQRSLNSLSSGERQLVFLAQALAQKAGLLLLDEPVSHLDLYYKSQFMKLISSLICGKVGKNNFLLPEGKKYAAAAVFHEPALAFRCDKILLLGRGWHFTGTPEKALTPDKLSELYGIEKDSPLLRIF